MWPRTSLVSTSTLIGSRTTCTDRVLEYRFRNFFQLKQLGTKLLKSKLKLQITFPRTHFKNTLQKIASRATGTFSTELNSQKSCLVFKHTPTGASCLIAYIKN